MCLLMLFAKIRYSRKFSNLQYCVFSFEASNELTKCFRGDLSEILSFWGAQSILSEALASQSIDGQCNLLAHPSAKTDYG